MGARTDVMLEWRDVDAIYGQGPQEEEAGAGWKGSAYTRCGVEELRARLAVVGSGSAAGAEAGFEKTAFQILAKCNETSL